MGQWAVVVPVERLAAERLFANDYVELPAGAPALPGDRVLLVAAGEPALVFGLGQVRLRAGAGPAVAYTHRRLDEPLPVADGLSGSGPSGLSVGLHSLDPAVFDEQAGQIGAGYRLDADKRTWLVSVNLPIEAATPPEAVRAFWSYVFQLGPSELPAFVSPAHDELAMQAFVLGAEANLDPEEDD